MTVGDAQGFICMEPTAVTPALPCSKTTAHIILTDMVMPNIVLASPPRKSEKMLPRHRGCGHDRSWVGRNRVQPMKLGPTTTSAPFSPQDNRLDLLADGTQTIPCSSVLYRRASAVGNIISSTMRI